MKPTSSHLAISSAWRAMTRSRSSAVGVRGASSFGVVAGDDVIGEMPDRLHISARGKELKGADADVARRDAGQHGAGQRHFTPDGLAGRDNGERPGGGDAERGHRLADDVLAQDRSERGAAIAVAGERRGAGALELDVAAHAVGIDDLAEKNGPAITELRHEVAELVAGIGHGERLAELGHPVARKDRHALGRRKQSGIEPELAGEILVQPNEAGRSDGRRRQTRKEPLRQPRVAVVEGKNVIASVVASISSPGA